MIEDLSGITVTFLSVLGTGGFIALGAFLVQKAKASRSSVDFEEDEVFINIALCATRYDLQTHYHDIGTGELHLWGRYPTSHHTLCGVEVGWDMKDQDSEATCETCLKELAKYAREFDPK
jgi:hypothetical protein